MQPNVVLITGCASGIGRATAREFLEEGWEVYATARNPADIQTLGDRAGCTIATLDVTDGDDVERVVGRVVDEQGRIDCLVNAAGYGQFGPVEDVPTAAVHRQFDANVYGPHRLVRAVLPHMREQEDGTVVTVSSVAGRVAFPGTGVYAGSMFAVEAMTDALRAETAEYGVNVVLVEPGPVDAGIPPDGEGTDDGQGVDGGGSADGGGSGGSGGSADSADEGGSDDRTVPGVERSGAYESVYDLLADGRAVGSGGPGTVSPERVAEDVVNAASATKPRARYPVGPVARVGVLGRFLPDSLRDRLYRLVSRLA